MRPSLAAEEIPPAGYEGRISALQQEEAGLQALGFERLDRFYLRMIPDVVVFAYRHRQEPMFFCLYHMGSRITADVVTRFAAEYSVTTCSTLDGGMAPRPPKSLIQCFDKSSWADLLEHHRKAIRFLESRNLKALDYKPSSFRAYLVQEVQTAFGHIRRISLWPGRLIFWTVTKRGRRFACPIEEQVRSGLVTLM